MVSSQPPSHDSQRVNNKYYGNKNASPIALQYQKFISPDAQQSLKEKWNDRTPNSLLTNIIHFGENASFTCDLKHNDTFYDALRVEGHSIEKKPKKEVD
jgi:hypothetical protein